VDHVWFSFFEGMHCHTAIVTGLVCSKFNHLTKELQSGSLTLEDFRNGNIESFKEPNTSISDHLNQIMSKQFDAPMVHNQHHLLAYIPNQTMTAADLIDATRCQSLWISNFKRTSANTTISKVLANWLEQTLHHSMKDMRMNPSYRPALDNGFSMYYQEACTTKSYKKKIIFMKEGTKFLMGTLCALQVRFGMSMSITHLT
jgi:hypothetical protein